MLQKVLVSISTAVCQDGVNISNKEQQSHPETRATRLVQDTTRFLLVSVNKKARDSTLRQTLARWIYEGIEHNGTVYRFLGYTESQVKAGKLMFFHEGEGWTVERMLESFGDLPGVYLKSGYGKYAARLGLSFSSTVQSLDIPLECAIEIPDLTAPDGSLHSDGCGMIRDSFAAQLCARHNLPPDTTVFQVRRGGIKGLLVRYPDNEFDVRCRTHSRTRGGHYMIAYRPSMFKYAGGPTCLELNNHNSPSASARLNVQFMALLLTLGVPFAIFQRLVLDQLDLIGSILTDREKALQYVKGELDAAAEDDFAQGLYAMLLARQELSEPYVRHKLQTFQRKQYITLRNKMSLRIPDAAYLFGVVDEAGVLAPNEVHVNLPNRSGVLVRDVIVGRNPSYHPGDFRKLRAVDHPSLRHHRNCIVFSSNAAHSIPDTIAGGDLDGDMYFVCWDPCLIPPREAPPFSRAQSATAAAQAGTAPASATRQLSNMPKAAIDTFMQLKFSRLLGMMAKEWTRQVELTPDLARSAYCQELVPLIESALDLMKSGEDFARLEKRFKQLQSRHAGHNLDDFKSPIQRLRDLIPEGEGEKLQNLSGRHDLSLILRDEDPTRWNRHLSEAVNVLPRFNKELSKAINLDSDYAESYASSADRDSKNRRADMVKQSYQSLYFGGGSKEQQCEQRMRASAWYYYGYTQDKPAFAWLGERYLNEIKAWWSNGNRPPLFVGAAIPRPAVCTAAPLSRVDTQETLIDQPCKTSQYSSFSETRNEVPMEIDGEMIPDDEPPVRHKHQAPGECEVRRRDTVLNEHVDVGICRSRPRCIESMQSNAPVELVRVAVTSDPTPKAPVATKISVPPGRCSVSTHEWTVISSNGFARRYLCKCGIEVREKKDNGFWIAVQYTIGEPRDANHTPPQPRHLHPGPEPDKSPVPKRRAVLVPVQGDYSLDDDSDDSIYMSADERTSQLPIHELSLPSRLRRSSADRTSGGTTVSDAPSSLSGLPLRRLPRRPGSDSLSAVGRSRQVSGSRRTSGSTAEFRTPASPAIELSPSGALSPSVITSQWPLVSANPKPTAPIATHFAPQCSISGAFHRWKVWGNATHRRYTCLGCSTVVKERKFGQPQVWVPAD